MVGKKTHLAVFPCSLCSTSPVRSAQALNRCGASFPSLSVIFTPGSAEQTEKADSGWHCTATSIAHHFCAEGFCGCNVYRLCCLSRKFQETSSNHNHDSQTPVNSTGCCISSLQPCIARVQTLSPTISCYSLLLGDVFGFLIC